VSKDNFSKRKKKYWWYEDKRRLWKVGP